MNIIKQNPYRVLGVLGNSSERELQKQIGIIKRFAEIGKTKSFDYDFEFIGGLSRSIDDIHHAASKIEQAHKKLLYSLFWFVNNNQFDEIAFNNLKDNNTEKAIDVWDKTLKGEVSSKNFSSYHNLSTLYIASSTINGQLQLQSLQKGIELKRRLIHSDSLMTFSTLVTGNDFAIDSNETSKLFVDEIVEIATPYINNNNGLRANDLISLFDAFPNTIRKYISSKFTEAPLSNIENLIEKTAVKRNEAPGSADEYGGDLYKATKNDAILLKTLLGKDDVQFQMVVNKLANELLQCSIDYFIEWRDSDEVDPGDAATRIVKYAKSVGSTGQVKNRIEENSEALQEWVDDKPSREKQKNIGEEVAFITRKLQEFLDGQISISASTDLVTSCKPKLTTIKNELGTHDEFYLQISSVIANNALGVLIEINNRAHEKAEQGAIELSTFKNTVSSIISAIDTIEILDMTIDIRSRFNMNKKAINDLHSQLSEHTQSSSGGCYIATMAYGDYNHPQVIALRKYRDDRLSRLILGRLFVNIYYAISPHLVRMLKNQKCLNRVIRHLLDRWVKHIK